MSDINEIFARRFRSEYKAQKWSVEKFCDKANITPPTLWRFKYGKSLPRVEILVDLADILNVSTDWLLGRSDKKR